MWAIIVGVVFLLIGLIGWGAMTKKPMYDPSPVTGYYMERSFEDSLLALGKELYEANCMVCHGRNGDGYPVTPEALVTYGGDLIYPRDFTGKTHAAGKVVFKYTWGGFGGEYASDEELKYIIRHGLYGTPMPGFEGFSDRELEAIVKYIKSLNPGWKDYKPTALPEVKVPDDLMSSERIERGRALFKSKCTSCHGDPEAGREPIQQPLSWYVPGTDSVQMIKARDFVNDVLRFPEPENIYRTIKVGIGGTPMNPAMWKELSDSAIWDLVAYVIYLNRFYGKEQKMVSNED